MRLITRLLHSAAVVLAAFAPMLVEKLLAGEERLLPLRWIFGEPAIKKLKRNRKFVLQVQELAERMPSLEVDEGLKLLGVIRCTQQ